MTTSPQGLTLSKPAGDDPIPETTLEYFRSRNKMRAFSCVHDEFERSGITQAIIAARLSKGQDRVSRLLGAPGNWTLNTLSELMLAISGAEPEYGVSRPFETAPRNQRKPEWLESARKPPSTVTGTISAPTQFILMSGPDGTLAQTLTSTTIQPVTTNG